MIGNTTKACLGLSTMLLAAAGATSVLAVDKTTDLEVNVREVLSVSVVAPTEWASGDADTFLRNKVSINVVSSNAAGFTASMTAKTTETSLVNEAKNTITLPTLATSTTRSGFPANYWGYSLDDTEAGSSASTYGAMVASTATPITLLSSNNASSGTKDFYFGAKSDITQAAGTYTGTVVISVVSGVIDNNNPATPTNPATPNDTLNTPTYSATTGGSADGTTSYTYRRTGAGTTTTTTEVTDGNNTSLYDGYTPPQGVVSRHMATTNVANTAAMAAGLGVAASIAAASGMLFFIVARRDEGEDEEA